MKKILPILLFLIPCVSIADSHQGRISMNSKMVMAGAPRSASVNQINGYTINNTTTNVAPAPAVIEETPKKDMREAERNACINNNIGIGNTFVWASKYSNTASYSTMVEDVDNPENNVCFVRVELKSDDSKISVSDVQSKYFMWGENITCGSWANEDTMRQRILDAKKGARVGGIIASTVGGVGLGVGAMELFGNKLIGGKVEGQKSLSETELYRSQLLALKDKDSSKYNRYVSALHELKAACENSAVKDQIKTDCEKYRDLYTEF